MNILITSAGRRVSLVRAFTKELKKKFPNGTVFTADAEPQLSAACLVAEAFVEVPRADDSNYISFLLEKCLDMEISIIIPTIDTELEILSRNLTLFTKAGILPIVSSYEFIQKCRNKRITHTFFEEHKIKVAKEYSKSKFTLPIFIKPEDGSRSIDTYVIREEHELRDFHFKNEKFMFLEYLNQEEYEEFTCDLYYDKAGILRCVVPRKRIEVRSGEVNKGLTMNNELVPLIRKNLGKIKGAKGCLTAQFFKHKRSGEIYGIEINARFGGGFPLSYLAGANYPAWILDEYLLDKPMEDRFDCWEKDLLMIRYDEEIMVHGYTG